MAQFNLRIVSGAGVLAGSWLLATQALAAQPPQIICSGATPSEDVSYENLAEKALEVEALLLDDQVRTSGATQLVDTLDVEAPAAGTAGAYQPLVLAQYCAAAGEAMRVAQNGSAERARSFLLSALSHAEQDYQPSLSATIAYRLALVVGSGAASPNSRSAKRELRAAIEPQVDRPAPPPGMNNLCGVLFEETSQDESNWFSTQASLECAFANASVAGDNRIASLSQLQLARAALSEADRRPQLRGQLRQQAVNAAAAGMPAAARLGDRPLRFELAARLLEASLDAGQGATAANSAAIAQLRSDATDSPSQQALVHALEGRLFAAQGRASAAAGSYRQALFFESQRAQPLRLADWYLLLADAEPDQRGAHVERAYRALETVRPLLPLIDPVTEESTFALRMQPVFKAAIAAEFNAAQMGGGVERIRAAQQIVETFRQAEIESTFGRNCVPPRDPIEPGDLAAGEILLYPILLDDRVELLVATAGAQGYQRLSPGTNANRDAVATMARKIAFSVGYGEDDSWKAPAAELYKILIQPIEDKLSAGSTLVIIPDGALRVLPFAALRDGAGKMLIERTRLAVAPALAYAQPGTRIERQLRVVAASLEQRVELPAGVFPALRGTSEEARVAAGLGNPDVKKGVLIEDFSREQLETAFAAEPVDILHLATHATFNGRSERSFIVASDGAISLNRLRELIEANRSRGKELSLIVLSACETAVGDDRATMGLAGTAVQAGAQSAIASLWQVDDIGTVELMRQFYANLATSDSRADALRKAQLALLADPGGLSDPSIWAAFSLMGGWR